MHHRSHSPQLLHHEPPAGRRLQRHLELLAAEALNEPPHPGAMRRRDAGSRQLAGRRVDPLRRDLRSMLIESHYDRHSGPPQAPWFERLRGPSAALELRRSLHVRPDGATAHAIYQVTPKVLGRRRATQALPVRQGRRHRRLESARRQPENQPQRPDVTAPTPATLTVTAVSADPPRTPPLTRKAALRRRWARALANRFSIAIGLAVRSNSLAPNAGNRIAAMSVSRREPRGASGTSADPGALTLSGVLLLVGFVVNAIQRMIWHPTGAEDDHEAIFREYAASDAWEATHLAEFVLVLVALAGLLVLCRALRRETPYLALLAASALIATGATWAVLQAVDGVALKQAVDAWIDASGTEEATRFADAETARWIEWGLQSYFRVLLDVAFLLLGAGAVVSRLVPSWLGVLLAVGGMLSLAVGFSVAYAGLESGFQDAVGIALQLVVLVFIVGLRR